MRTGFGRFFADVVHTKGGNHNKVRCAFEVGGVVDAAHRLNAVHARHTPVHKHHFVGVASICTGNGVNGLLTGTCQVHLHFQAQQLLGQDFAGNWVVVHHQGAEALDRNRHFLAVLFGTNTQPCGELEVAAHTGLRFNPDLAVHQLNHALANGQAQTCTAILAGGRTIGLTKGLEQATGLLWRHANTGVFHIHLELDTAFLFADHHNRHLDVPCLGKLDRIVDQVRQHLPQAQRVAQQIARHIGSYMDQKFQTLIVRLVANHGGHVRHNIVQPEGDVFHLDLASFDFGEVQNVVNNAQQRHTRAVDFGNVVALFGIQIGLERQVRHTNNRIHRRTNFMAHIRQEHALGLCGFFRFGTCGFHLHRLGFHFGVNALHLVTLRQELLFLLQQFGF